MNFLVQLLEEYFQEAARQDGIAARYFQIAKRNVAIQFAGDRWVADLTGALAHLERPSVDMAGGLTVSVWDGGTAPANHLLRAYLFTLTNWWYSYTGPRGELLDVHGGNIEAHYHPDTGTLSVVDRQRGRAFYWKRDRAAIPYYEECAPFRVLLHSYLRETGAHMVHGAAVGTSEAAVLLVGKGGSGKSTTALACLHSGMRYAGDDYCVVAEDGDGGFDVHSLYCMAKLVAMSDLDRFPGLDRHVVNRTLESGDKVAVSLQAHTAGRLAEQLPLRALLAPEIAGDGHTALVACSAKEATLALAPSTMAQLPFSGPKDLWFLGAMTRRLPCYRMLLGRDLQQVSDRIAALLRAQGSKADGLEANRVAAGSAR
ncbi:MAG TPA: hypothetical protein VHW09_12020 [Bryobacteraceae bacterium]|nr:hypothetical protein [Bryobacteraceae bacterium]